MRYAAFLLMVVVNGDCAFCQDVDADKNADQQHRNVDPLHGVPITYYVPEGLTTPKHLRFEQQTQLGPYCGPNSIYLLLKLENILVIYDELLKRIQVGSQGCSLAELQEIADSYGLPCDVRKVTLKELYSLNPPYILHIATPAESSQQATGAKNHFVVVTRLDPGENLVGIDPNSGSRSAWTRTYLSRNFSGYVLTPIKKPANITTKVILGVVFVILTIYNLFLFRRKQK